MNIQAIGLLIIAAGIHSGWNLLSKRSLDSQAFLWLMMVMATVIFFVPFCLLYTPIRPIGWGYIALSGLLESIYVLLLGSAYQRGDLSLVYPLARGSAILFITLLALVLLDERLSLLGATGIAVIVAGMYVVNLKGLDRHSLGAPLASLGERPSQLALLTGLSIASYSLIDKLGIRYVDPVLYLYLVFGAGALFLAPYMLLVRRAAALREWQAHKGRISLVGVMSGATYLLVLSVLTGAQISYVASVREVSIVFAALMGTTILREPFGQQKVLGAILIFIGIVCISLAR